MQGPPGAPTIIGMKDVGQDTIVLSWVEGFHGGYDQQIYFQTSTNNQVWTDRSTITLSLNNHTVPRNTTITELTSVRFYLRMFASNVWGVSSMSEVWNITLEGICLSVSHMYLLILSIIIPSIKINLNINVT